MSTVHARSSASAASAPAPGSISSWAETIKTRCSCSRRKQKRRCWSVSSARASTPSHGRRVVVGQRLMQAASDIFLGWFRVKGTDGRLRHYYVRQLHDWKGGVDVGDLPGAGGDALRPAVRSHARPRACTLGRPNRDRVVPGQGKRIRQRDRRLRRRVRRPERT